MGFQFVTLDSVEATRLEMSFTKEEIVAALTEMNGDKAPWLDGFTVTFWQAKWDTMKGEVLKMFNAFF